MDDDRQQAFFKDKLTQSLDGYVERPVIDTLPSGIYKIDVGVVSPTFEGMNEARRQEIVWGRVLETFEVDEWRRIEFIYTDSPSEAAARQIAEPKVVASP